MCSCLFFKIDVFYITEYLLICIIKIYFKRLIICYIHQESMSDKLQKNVSSFYWTVFIIVVFNSGILSSKLLDRFPGKIFYILRYFQMDPIDQDPPGKIEQLTNPGKIEQLTNKIWNNNSISCLH